MAMSVGDSEHPQTHEIIDGSWREDKTPVVQTLPRSLGRNNTQFAIKQRILLRDYVTSDVGSVPWQENMV